ncbi:MAG: LptE family protein [Bacteroidales bacterium]|nr:LptE family protein [Bacteroidales bacterium]
MRNILLFILILVVTGCKINYSLSGIEIPPDVKTVSVQYFNNRASTVQPGLSQRFTDALKDKIQAKTRLILVNQTGDLNFEGEITLYQTQPVNVQSGDVAAQNKFTIGITVRYTNYKYPENNFSQTFSRYENYPSSQNFNTAAESLTDDIIDQILEDIINKAFINW